MLILGAIIVMVAVVMIGGLKGMELNVALSAARLGAEEFVSMRPYLTLGSMDYVSSSSVTVITPRFTAYYSVPAGDIALANQSAFKEVVSVFAPKATALPASGCQMASFQTYCISPVINTPLP